MGLFDIFKKNKELSFIYDLDLIGEHSKKTILKRVAIETCINYLSKTISQSEFKVKRGGEYVVDELHYRLNVRPNKNMSSSMFWQTVIYKLIFDNEVLVIQADDGDLLIADDFERVKYAVFENVFKNVVIDDYEFKRRYRSSEVFYLEYNNKSLQPLIDELFHDYGEMFGRLVSSQKRKNQVRSTVDMDFAGPMTQEKRQNLQEFINKIYNAIETKDVAIVPQQKGLTYNEHTKNTTGTGNSVDEINKLTNGFLDQVAMAMGIPVGLLHGDLADVEKQTKNYKVFTVGPIINKIKDEANAKFLELEEYFKGDRIDVRQVFYKDIFELATSIDKLRSSGVMNGNEIRDELGLSTVDNPILDEYVITKNYGALDSQTEGTSEGGDEENEQTGNE